MDSQDQRRTSRRLNFILYTRIDIDPPLQSARRIGRFGIEQVIDRDSLVDHR